MAKTIPMIITNERILIYDIENEEFKVFDMSRIDAQPNIPFYHYFAERIAGCQLEFKNYMKSIYGKKLTKYILAIVVPDDTTKLESIFINEFFLHSGACKAVVQIKMGQALDKHNPKYISISKSSRNIILQYINNNEVIVSKIYDRDCIDSKQILEDAKRLHIDIEYEDVPIYINNFNMNMDKFFDIGEVISPKEFLDKIAVIDVEKE